MHFDHEHESGLCERRQVRKEWRRGDDAQHQMEAREHARQGGTSLARAVRVAGSERSRPPRRVRRDSAG